MKIKLFALILLVSGLCSAQPVNPVQKKMDVTKLSTEAYKLIGDYEFSGFRVAQFLLPELSHFSYILYSDDKAMLVDPGRDLHAYKAFTEKHKLKIIGVYLTHPHADFIAGHTQAIADFKCPVYINKASKVDFPHDAVYDGTEIKIGKAVLKIVTTPGHTPDSTCGYVYGEPRQKHPACIFTGDTLFVGSVGRPDLLGVKMPASRLAEMLYFSLWNKLLQAGDNAVIFPAHGAGSLCGSKLDKKPFSTIGEQKKTNEYLKNSNQKRFIALVMSNLPAAPGYFSHDAEINKKGPKVVDWASLPNKHTLPFESLASQKYYVIDVRTHEQYEKGHIPGSIPIPASKRMTSWVGQVVPVKFRMILVVDNHEQANDAALRLIRIGYKPQYLFFSEWVKAGRKVSKTRFISVEEFAKKLDSDRPPIILDVRTQEEFDTEHIPNSVHIALTKLADRAIYLDPLKPAVSVCRNGYRGGIAMGLLIRYGFRNIETLKGGFLAWKQAGKPVASMPKPKQPMPVKPHSDSP
ncbi:MAG: MBL fold metallo-hydrolase [Lentisphaerae bacterium]|nr:MBL fold metallo-hydrolase [Lentisphaerota bacterium]MCP4101190.1 MBL fold metallo-hydrolase [Lentisphaerota bacterium]